MINLKKLLVILIFSLLSWSSAHSKVHEDFKIKSIQILPENPVENIPFRLLGQFVGDRVIFDGYPEEGPPYQVQGGVIRVEVLILGITIFCPPNCPGSPQIPPIDNTFSVNIDSLPAGNYSVEFYINNRKDLEKVLTLPLVVHAKEIAALPALNSAGTYMLIICIGLLGIYAKYYRLTTKTGA